MNKKILVAIGIVALLVSMGSVSARPLLDAETAYGNLFSESYTATIQQITNEDADMLREYIAGNVIYAGTTTEDKGDEMITVYVWRDSQGQRIDDTQLWGGVPQIDDEEFETRADVTGDGHITEADALAIEEYASFSSATFPRFQETGDTAMITSEVDTIDEAVSFTIMQISSNWMITGVNLIIMFFIVFFAMLFVSIVVIRAAEISPKKPVTMYLIIIASVISTVAFYFIELLFMQVFIGGVVGIAIAAICIAGIYAGISYGWFGIAKKDTAEFTLALTVITLVLWAAMNAYWMM